MASSPVQTQEACVPGMEKQGLSQPVTALSVPQFPLMSGQFVSPSGCPAPCGARHWRWVGSDGLIVVGGTGGGGQWVPVEEEVVLINGQEGSRGSGWSSVVRHESRYQSARE